MRETAQEFKVGLFVVLGAGLLVAALLNMDVFYVKSGYNLRLLFNYASGLEVGAPVQLAGVPVGSVQRVHIEKDAEGRTRIEVLARIRRDISIDKEAQVRINSHTLLGQKYVEILPGPPGTAAASEGELLLGHDPVMLESITATGDRVVRKLESSVDYLNELIGDDAFRAKIKDNVANLNALTADLKEVTASLKVILARLRDGEGTMGKLLTDEAVYQDVKALIRDLRDHPWKLLRKEDEKKKGFALF
jgi:phospholipid/cholesterol/gamma-HCH transport system substrate-binding protein